MATFRTSQSHVNHAIMTSLTSLPSLRLTLFLFLFLLFFSSLLGHLSTLAYMFPCKTYSQHHLSVLGIEVRGEGEGVEEGERMGGSSGNE